MNIKFKFNLAMGKPIIKLHKSISVVVYFLLQKKCKGFYVKWFKEDWVSFDESLDNVKFKNETEENNKSVEIYLLCSNNIDEDIWQLLMILI